MVCPFNITLQSKGRRNYQTKLSTVRRMKVQSRFGVVTFSTDCIVCEVVPRNDLLGCKHL